MIKTTNKINATSKKYKNKVLLESINITYYLRKKWKKNYLSNLKVFKITNKNQTKQLKKKKNLSNHLDKQKYKSYYKKNNIQKTLKKKII